MTFSKLTYFGRLFLGDSPASALSMVNSALDWIALSASMKM